jgi:hypothetical protein
MSAGVERGRARVSAYVYGNILVLAAVLTATPHTIDDGHAAVVVIATTVTTYLAHVVAHAVGGTIGVPAGTPSITRDELRDALPIVSSGSLPAMILLVGALTELDPVLAELVAAGVVIVRLVGIGAVVDRYGGSNRRWSWATGLLVGGASVLIVVLKLVFGH